MCVRVGERESWALEGSIWRLFFAAAQVKSSSELTKGLWEGQQFNLDMFLPTGAYVCWRTLPFLLVNYNVLHYALYYFIFCHLMHYTWTIWMSSTRVMTPDNQSVSALFRQDWYQYTQCCVMLTSSVRIWHWTLIRHEYVPTDFYTMHHTGYFILNSLIVIQNTFPSTPLSTVKHVAGNYSLTLLT